MNKIYIDGSYCPHYRCGGWAFHIKSFNSTVVTKCDSLRHAKSAYQSEAYALLNALEYMELHPEESKEFLAKPFTIVTDNQNLAARVEKENEYLHQMNFHRPEPWDKIHRMMFRLGPIRLKVFWKSFKDDNIGTIVHGHAKNSMVAERKLIEATYADTKTE